MTSDKDYLQLSAPNVQIFNLSFKNISEKSSCGNSLEDLEIKIIMGDSSDNIPSVFPKCGVKTAQKCIEDPEFFKKKMDVCEKYYSQYELNKTLVDFNCIPTNLVDEFLSSIGIKK
jgi:5'-3' exonuclease